MEEIKEGSLQTCRSGKLFNVTWTIRPAAYTCPSSGLESIYKTRSAVKRHFLVMQNAYITPQWCVMERDPDSMDSVCSKQR